MFLYNLVLVANNEKSWYIDNLKPHYYCKCTVYSLLSQGDGSLHEDLTQSMTVVCVSLSRPKVFTPGKRHSRHATSHNSVWFQLLLLSGKVRFKGWIAQLRNVEMREEGKANPNWTDGGSREENLQIKKKEENNEDILFGSSGTIHGCMEPCISLTLIIVNHSNYYHQNHPWLSW